MLYQANNKTAKHSLKTAEVDDAKTYQCCFTAISVVTWSTVTFMSSQNTLMAIDLDNHSCVPFHPTRYTLLIDAADKASSVSDCNRTTVISSW